MIFVLSFFFFHSSVPFLFCNEKTNTVTISSKYTSSFKESH